jgi:hypothetical protein
LTLKGCPALLCAMIISKEVDLKELAKKGRQWSWERESCPRCHRGCWGHGYVARYFNGFVEALFLKRWRCPSCGLVITCRPKSHWRRFQESISGMYRALLIRLKELRWPAWAPRQRGGHWLRTLIQNARAHLLMRDSLIETVKFYQRKNLVIFDLHQTQVSKRGWNPTDSCHYQMPCPFVLVF